MRLSALRWTFTTGALAGLACSALAGTAAAAAVHPAAHRQAPALSTITIAEADTPDTLDPDKSGTAVTGLIMRWVGDTMVAVNPYTLKVVPDLATSWKVSKNGLTYVFTLRKGVTFQDGTPFNARAMAYSLERAQRLGHSAGALLQPVKSIKVLGAYSLQIVLKTPYAPFLTAGLANPDLMAISPTAVKKEGASFASKPVGTGPLEVSQYIAGKSVTLTRNPNYHWAPSFYKNRGPVRFQKLVLEFLPNNTTVVNGLLSGELQGGGILASSLNRFQNNPQFKLYKSLGQGLNLYITMNFKNPALDILNVRKAINLAINRHDIIKLALQGYGVPAYGPLPPTIFGFDKNTRKYGYHSNPAEAKRLLAQAGFKMVNGVMTKGAMKLEFTFDVGNFPTWVTASQVIQQELAKVGIQVKINTLDFASDLSDLEKGDADLGLMGYTYDDPDVLYLFLHSSQIGTGLNMSYYKSRTLDRLLTAGRETTNQAARAAVYVRIQKYMDANAIWAPIWVAQNFTVAQANIKGLEFTPLYGLMVQDIQ